MLKTQLIRSRNSSLVVVFECGADDENDDIVEEALSALAQCSSRWNSLTIVAQQLKRLPNIRGRVPLLEKLSVQEMLEEESDDGYDSDELSSRAIGHFAIAPRLRVVEMEIGAPFFELPWGGITHYESNGSWEDHTFALMRLRNVESCTLLFAHEFNGNERSTWGSRAVELGKLRKLDIDTERYNFGEPYWNWPNWLRVPALTSLTIGDSLLGGLAEVLQVSNCRLVELHVTGGAPTVEAIRPVFESVPDLVELGIDLSHSFVHPYGGELIALLTLKPRCSVVLAKLRTIAMDSPTVEMESAIRAMVSSRWGTTDPAVSRLQAVTITGCSVMGRRLTAKLEQLRGEGLSVSVRD
ncbi:hypothetical protein C8R46DRAFT_1114029 [Mycena filopes]|nr:hypothetical protein C8R46DRAFT_1114029 [Mycena filopes]